MKNREIKFRAYFKGIMYYSDSQESAYMLNIPLGKSIIGCFMAAFAFDETLMQFTGLYDKNGKEIYEGDIVSITNDFGYSELATIEYGLDNMAAFCYRYCDDNFILAVSDIATCDTNIVGNLHQHPDLLK